MDEPRSSPMNSSVFAAWLVYKRDSKRFDVIDAAVMQRSNS